MGVHQDIRKFQKFLNLESLLATHQKLLISKKMVNSHHEIVRSAAVEQSYELLLMQLDGLHLDDDFTSSYYDINMIFTQLLYKNH